MDKNEFTLEQYRLHESRVIRDAIHGYITFEYLPIWQLIATAREFDSCLHFFTNQIAQNVDYINAFEFFYCQIFEIICSNT